LLLQLRTLQHRTATIPVIAIDSETVDITQTSMKLINFYLFAMAFDTIICDTWRYSLRGNTEQILAISAVPRLESKQSLMQQPLKCALLS